jgi:hypothetical protein
MDKAWTDSSFKVEPLYRTREPAPQRAERSASRSLYYKSLPSEFAMNTIRNELEKAIEQAKLRDANIDKEAYDVCGSPW